VYGWYYDNSVLLEDPGVQYKFYGNKICISLAQVCGMTSEGLKQRAMCSRKRGQPLKKT